MADQWSDIYFDKQDRNILALVNRLLESRSGAIGKMVCLIKPSSSWNKKNLLPLLSRVWPMRL